ncbi:MAG TPA: 3-hydroxyacyl-CoA dehydrogenase NAD-binding domain-containing protein [Steroidobacteraceae bacterium]|jgi:3-hydroxyacyl-CoA dehydrogenase/enoyl-CoA hydratase/3-hydroxybutyryl-CoA epimerase|nr:3-hydroxyacyl-CoA dehydrogenase NAD-binding domain-containing protein [Steroidobacteraceae bacterium]
MTDTEASAAAGWKLETDADQIAWLTFDKPGSSANLLSQAVLSELERLLRSIEGQRVRGLVIRSAKASGFIAGADIREFPALESSTAALDLIRQGQRTFARIEALPCPTVAAIHGFALGGGLELALACRYRVAVGDSKLNLGLPEVQLGVHPGFGGSVRSVRLLGVRAAMTLMLTGRSVRADRAQRIGLVDRLVHRPGELDDAARQIVLSAPPPHRPPLVERALSWPGVRALMRPVLLRQVAAHARREHYPAPYALIDLWSRYGARGEAAYAAEAESFAALIRSETARSLIRVFLLQDRLKGLAGKSRVTFERVHVIGAGVMGGDIAAWCALRGLKVTLQDRDLKFIDPALTRARALFEKRLSTPAERAQAAERLSADVAGAGVAQADVLIEAIFEDLDAKRALYAAAEPRMQASALLATNTSSLTLETLSPTLRDPGHFVGLHFFNPVAQMPLIEVVHSAQTRPEVLSAALVFSRRIDKLPLPCRSSPGFLVNRVLFPYLHEALHAAGEGIAFNAIDRAAVEFGMPMGPIELCDVVGLDVVLHVGEIVTRELQREAPPYTEKLRQRVQSGQLGRKSEQGFYRWQDGKIMRDDSRMPPPSDLSDRLILVLVNECVACAREGVVADVDLIDAGVIFGTGFAPFRGGPINYARTRGIDACVARMREFELRYGPRFRADSGWSEIARGPAGMREVAPKVEP